MYINLWHCRRHMTIALPKNELDDVEISHKFSISGREFYFKIHGFRNYGDVYELDCLAAKEGSTISGLLAGVMATASAGLQCGVPLEAIAEEWKEKRFEPSGHTENPGIPYAKSILDYLGQYLEHYRAVFPPEEKTPFKARCEVSSDAPLVTHKFSLGGHKGYLTFATEPPFGFIRLIMAREGSAINGLLEGLSGTATLCLQYGVSPEALFRRWKGLRFPPSGVDAVVGEYASVVDYAARYIANAERKMVQHN